MKTRILALSAAFVFAALAWGGTAGAVVVEYTYEEELQNSSFSTIVGEVLPGGTCAFAPPELNLGSGQAAIERRQVSMDFDTCSTVVEVGTPTVFEDEPGGVSEAESAGEPASAPAALLPSRSGYYEIRWEDILNIDVTKSRARLTWKWNGSCVVSGSGSGYWWWRSSTGWRLDDPGSKAWLTKSCASYRTHAQSHFWNSSFCSPLPITDIIVQDMRFRGGAQGGYGAAVWRTYADDDCISLHWRDTIRITS